MEKEVKSKTQNKLNFENNVSALAACEEDEAQDPSLGCFRDLMKKFFTTD